MYIANKDSSLRAILLYDFFRLIFIIYFWLFSNLFFFNWFNSRFRQLNLFGSKIKKVFVLNNFGNRIP